MNRTIIRASLLSALLLIVAAAGTAKSTTLQAQELVGLFGEVTGITTPSSGLYELTLVTTTKDVQRVVATDENTSVTIPGRERAQPADISLGDFLAVLAGGADNRLEAVRILVKPNRAVVHAHITGSLVGAVGEQVSIMDRVGNVVTADVFLEGKGIDPAEVVTAVVRQDIKTGGLSILAAQPADANITRLAIALQSAVDTGATENRENLGSRLRASTTGHLTTLQEILYRVGPDLGFFYTQALERTLRSHEERLATFDLGAPTVKLAGFIQDIDRPRGIISVSQQEGPQVQLKLTAETTIRLFGVDVHPENLSTGQHAGQRIESVYDPQTGEAHTINVIVPVLGDNLVGSLLAQARMGELEGTVTAVVPPAVVVTLATDMPFRLTTTPDTRIRVEERPADLQRLFLGARVKVRYDPSTIQALAIDTFDENPGQEFISGVVKSLNLKEPSISITSLDGQTVTLNIPEGRTERDGLGIPNALIRFGDLVRPTSRYNTGTREVVKLALKAEGPQVRGTVRGKGTTPGGNNYVTISTGELDLVTVTISETTEISSKRDRAAFPDIEVGQRVTSAVINPRTLVTAQLALGSPKSLRATGTIFHLDRQLFIVTVTPAVGEPLKLLVPNKPGIITLDGNPRANFGDLEEGDELQLAFYRPDGVVVKYGRHIPVGSPLLELLQIPYTEDRCAKGIKWEFSFV